MEGGNKNLKLNVKDTKLVHIGSGPTKPIYIGQDEMEEVRHFKYLRSFKINNAKCSIRIKCRNWHGLETDDRPHLRLKRTKLE